MRSWKRILKVVVLRVPLIQKLYRRGYFSPAVRRQRFANFLVRLILRQNIGCPWSVHYTSKIIAHEKIKFGPGVEKSLMFSGGCYLQGGNGIEIGEGTIFGPGAKIISANHDPNNLDHWLPERSIKIGRNCWIGANAVILPGVELGDRVIVGAGAVVTKSFPSGVTVAGNPASIIRDPKEVTKESD